MKFAFACAFLFCSFIPVYAGQAPGAAGSPDIAISHKDRFYTSDQFSNTVSVIAPADNKLLELQPGNSCYRQRRAQDRWADKTGKPVLSRHRSHTRWYAGLADTQGCWQNHGF